MNECSHCDGQGWYVDHSDECYGKGECVGCEGVQRECERCGGTGHQSGSFTTSRMEAAE